MSRLLQICALLVLATGLRPALGFSLLGPLTGEPGGEAWQVERVGHNLGGDIGSVKNLTEEYRWNQPIITYAFDPSFINYFGSNGIAAVEAAISVFNSLPDVSTLSPNLDEYPLLAANGAITTFRDSRRINYTARTLNLRDLKSFAMGTLTEKLGLASPERYTWALRGREIGAGGAPTNYLVILRNFDPVTYMPTRYVNGSRYTYQIIDGDTISDAEEFAADPESTLYSFTSVANLIDGGTVGFTAGSFFTYLTRDDIGGLRYMYDRDNLNWEGFGPGTQITAPDFTSLTLLTNQDLVSFSQFTFQNPPAAVLAAFPDLVIQTTSPFPTTEVQVAGFTLTNVRPPWGDPFTSNFIFAPILQTNPVIRYNYSFANVITNYSSPTTIVRTELSGFDEEPWSTPANPIYRTNITEDVVNLPSGGFIIVPTNVGTINFTGFAVSNVIGITNIILSTNLVDNGLPRPLQIKETYLFTNTIFVINPSLVTDAPASVLRGGVGKINFQRLGDAIFTGTNFLHTNAFVASYYTNGVLVSNVFSRVSNQPDILFAAADLGVTPNIAAPVIIRRSVGWVSNADLNSSIPAQGGPGNIFGPTTVIFSKVGPTLQGVWPILITEEASFPYLFWGSFDGSTNPPVVYPKDVTLEDIEVLITGGLAP